MSPGIARVADTRPDDRRRTKHPLVGRSPQMEADKGEVGLDIADISRVRRVVGHIRVDWNLLRVVSKITISTS